MSRIFLFSLCVALLVHSVLYFVMPDIWLRHSQNSSTLRELAVVVTKQVQPAPEANSKASKPAAQPDPEPSKTIINSVSKNKKTAGPSPPQPDAKLEPRADPKSASPEIDPQQTDKQLLGKYGFNQKLAKLADQPLTKMLNQRFEVQSRFSHGANGELFMKEAGSCFEIKEEEGIQVFWFSDRCKKESAIDIEQAVESVKSPYH